MRKNLFYLFTLLIAINFFSSCSNRDKYAAEIKQLDSLQQTLNRIVVDFKKIDTSIVIAKRDSIISHLTFIYNNYKDTMDKETAIFLQEYRSIKKPLDAFIKGYKETLEEIEYSEKQVNSLVHDLKNNLMEDEKAKQYFTDEKFAMEQLVRKMDEMISFLNENIRKYDELYPKVEEEINKLRNVIGANN